MPKIYTLSLLSNMSSDLKSGAIKYKAKLQAISSYFDISRNAAKYIYHRRRRGVPFKAPKDKNYIAWSIKLQNALIRADKEPGFKWANLVFGKEEEVLAEYKINVQNQSDEIYVELAHLTDLDAMDLTDDDDEWSLVTNKPSPENRKNKHILQQLYLLHHDKVE